MAPLLRIDPRDSRPIWRQIEEGVQHLVARGALPAGSGVPSVRDFAKELQVNPATVFKAYQRLTDAGVLTARRGEGTFVSATPPPPESVQRNERLREEALRFASVAVTLGASRAEALSNVESAWASLSGSRAQSRPADAADAAEGEEG